MMKTLVALLLPLLALPALAQPSLKMMIPANPGGGWDQTGRGLAAAMQSAKLVSSVQFDNKGGAPGITPQLRDGLVKLVKEATETPAWKATLEKLGWTPFFLGGDNYGRFIDEDIKRVGAIIESLGLKK